MAHALISYCELLFNEKTALFLCSSSFGAFSFCFFVKLHFFVFPLFSVHFSYLHILIYVFLREQKSVNLRTGGVHSMHVDYDIGNWPSCNCSLACSATLLQLSLAYIKNIKTQKSEA